MSIHQIAELIGCARSVISTHLREAGILARVNNRENKFRSQLGYGESWRGNRVVPNKRELRVIAHMQKLRAKGLSYWKIAERLNTDCVPTKNNKAWSAKAVHQIIIRVSNRKT